MWCSTWSVVAAILRVLSSCRMEKILRLLSPHLANFIAKPGQVLFQEAALQLQPMHEPDELDDEFAFAALFG